MHSPVPLKRALLSGGKLAKGELTELPSDYRFQRLRLSSLSRSLPDLPASVRELAAHEHRHPQPPLEPGAPQAQRPRQVAGRPQGEDLAGDPTAATVAAVAATVRFGSALPAHRQASRRQELGCLDDGQGRVIAGLFLSANMPYLL